MPISGIFWQGGLLRIVMSAANLISILIIPKHYLIYFPPPQKKVLKCAISRQAKASKLSLVFWLNEIVEMSVPEGRDCMAKLTIYLFFLYYIINYILYYDNIV